MRPPIQTKTSKGTVSTLSKPLSMKILLAILLTAVLTVPAVAGDTVVNIPVWPAYAPNETTMALGDSTTTDSGNSQVTNVTSPHLYVYLIPDGKAHPAVLIFPGGGYSYLSKDTEGTQVAEWLNSLGYVAAVLLYRVPNNRDGAYQDAQRSVSLLRSRSAEFGLDPQHVGVMGFSAGGHLAARLSAGYEKRAYTPVDQSDRTSCRPDFTLLIYPAYLADQTTGVLAPEVMPNGNMPPVFLAQTKQDPFFDILPYSAAMLSEALPVKMLAYEGGGHGYGLYPAADQPVAQWPKEAAAWIARQVASSPMP
jgi:acetyl esterase/lipase